MKDITFRELMIRDLQNLNRWKFAVMQQMEELQTLELEYAAIKATNYDKMPGGSGDNVQEEKLVTAMAKKDELQANLAWNKKRVEDMERLLAQLGEEETQVIKITVIERSSFDTASQLLHCDISTISRKRNKALSHLCQLRHGAVYQP